MLYTGSYFLVFQKNVLASQPFKDFWNSVLPFSDKFQIIRSYEIGLSNFLTQNGFQAKVYIASTDLKSIFHTDAVINPTCNYSLKLLKKGMLFVKVELLRDNPIGIRLGPVYEALSKTNYDLGLIEFDRPIKQVSSKKLLFRIIKLFFLLIKGIGAKIKILLL